MKKTIPAWVSFAACLFLAATAGYGATITNVQMTPASPASLLLNEQVNVTFDYYTAVFGGWEWKLAESVADAHNFINGLGGYSQPVMDARMTGVWTGTELKIQIFHKTEAEGQLFGDWNWKMCENITDAHDFINGLGAYTQPVQDARITAIWTGTDTRFYIFYKYAPGGRIFGDWNWHLAASVAEVHDFINGLGAYTQPVQDARITGVWTGTEMRFHIFYKPGTDKPIFGTWGWKMSENITDAHNFINGLGSYAQPVKDARITGVWTGTQTRFYIFYKSGTPDDLLIFVRPFTNGSTTLWAMNSGSPLYPAGKGSGSGWFTVINGEVTVDTLRLRVTNTDETVEYLEVFYPVEYHFGDGTGIQPLPVNANYPKIPFLHQNYPNPFNPTTKIRVELPKEGRVTLKVYDMRGREVRTLIDGEMVAGYFEAIWDGRNGRGEPVTSGMYLYHLQTPDAVLIRRMVLLR